MRGAPTRTGEGAGLAQAPLPVRDGPDDGLDSADDRGDGDEGALPLALVVARVRRIAAVVAHDPQGAFGDDHVEGEGGGDLAGCEVGFIDRDAVDLQDPVVPAAHAVSADADDALDQGLLAAARYEADEFPDGLERRSRLRGGRDPAE